MDGRGRRLSSNGWIPGFSEAQAVDGRKVKDAKEAIKKETKGEDELKREENENTTKEEMPTTWERGSGRMS
jgi:hypothetical protein